MWKEKSVCSKSPLSSQCRQGKGALENPFSSMAVKSQGSLMERMHSHTTWSSCWVGFAAIFHLFCPLHNQDLAAMAMNHRTSVAGEAAAGLQGGTGIRQPRTAQRGRKREDQIKRCRGSSWEEACTASAPWPQPPMPAHTKHQLRGN